MLFFSPWERQAVEVLLPHMLLNHSDDLIGGRGFSQTGMVADNAVIFFDLMFADGGGEKDDGGILDDWISFDEGSDVPAGHPRHDDVEQNKVGFYLLRSRIGVFTPVHDVNFIIARILEVQFEKVSEAFLVVH